jgi:hypothetical protein
MDKVQETTFTDWEVLFRLWDIKKKYCEYYTVTLVQNIRPGHDAWKQ